MPQSSCVFCKIAAGEIPAHMVYEDGQTMAFLDLDPLFPGHVLVCPRAHHNTLADVQADLISPLFSAVQLLAKAVEKAVEAEGTFVAVNNKVSQSVPHLHVHVVPRRRKDGLKGFFWPKHPYHDDNAKETVRYAIEHEVKRLLK